MIGSAGSLARRQIDIRMRAEFRKRPSCEDMIDSPAPVVAKRISEVIPIGVLHPFRVELPENVNETPRGRGFVGIASVDVEIDIVDAALRVINIDGLGSDIQISKPESE